ncbi:MAG: hypothetical protein LBM71_02450 [Elusimicrobiota bacterium]|jgi:uncharacterized membrane protein YphA (DoxX/SURF4 family)|nr:hypothetical protein [Elusimicrobiota bacterium]
MGRISDKTFSLLVFAQRALLALAFLFLNIGQTLHLNAFIQNGIDIGLPYAHIICTTVVVLTYLASLLILFGLTFRFATILMILVALFSGFFFFAGSFNKVNITGVLFAIIILQSFLVAGPGKISLDYYLAKRHAKNNKRLTFR